jgi:Abortive infection alpha
MAKPDEPENSEGDFSVNVDLGLGDLIPKEVVQQAYKDGVSGAAKEIGKLGKDAVKTLRFLLAPLQIGAALQDRLARMVERISNKVPASQRMEPPAELVGPTLEKMRYLDEGGPLWTMFEEVLTRSIDVEKNTTVHPAFPHIISQLSRDEAWILFRLRQKKVFNVVDTLDYDKTQNRFFNRKVEKSEIPDAELYRPESVELYYSHLESLSLLNWPVEKQDPIVSQGVQTGLRRYSKMRLTDFGNVFVEACIPENGFEKFSKNV